MLLQAGIDAHTVQETEELIDQWDKLVESMNMLKFNVVVLDEKMVGDPTKLNNVVGFRGKGAAGVCRVREKQLCVQIPLPWDVVQEKNA